VSGLAALANAGVLASAAPARARLERALADPARAQRAVLARIVRENAGTAFARAHDFAGVRAGPSLAADFRARVPLRAWGAFGDEMRRVRAGEPGVLTAAPVRFLEPSGGSSGADKLVPYTRGLLAEFSAATLPWLYDLLRHRPRLRAGRAYWAVTPPGSRPPHAPNAPPVGMEHDSDYFPPAARALLDRVLGVPRVVGDAPDLAACRHLTLRALLALDDLAFVSVWNPSFLTLLAAALDAGWDALLGDLESGAVSVPLPGAVAAAARRALPARPARAAALRRRFGRRPPEDLGELWPRLALVSCWADGHAARALDGMRRRFPAVEVQPKGLLATEGVVSVPLFEAGGAVAAVTSHYLEFVPEGDASGDDAMGVEALEAGRTYEVALTTSGGLYRYRLRDLVRVEGFHRATPVLAFRGRADRASDLRGEKLTAAFVEDALGRALAAAGVRTPFAMLAPSWGELPRYRLYVDADPDGAERAATAVEAVLRGAHHYALCRALGQLGAVEGVAVPNGEAAYERARAARGARGGAIKPPALEPELGWEGVFGAGAVDAVELAAVGR